MPDAPIDCLTLRRPLDGLTYVFRRRADGAFARDDQPALTICHHPALGWTMHDPQTGALTGRPWDDAQRHAPDQPAQGVWVSRKGAKSHVYDLTHGAPPTPDGGRVRTAWAGDLAAIAAFDEFNGERAAEVAAATCLVALDGAGQVAGYASWAARGLLGQPFLATLCVRPDARRQGLASALLQAAQQRAPGRWLLSSTEDWCAPMQTLFERLGWQRCGPGRPRASLPGCRAAAVQHGGDQLLGVRNMLVQQGVPGYGVRCWAGWKLPAGTPTAGLQKWTQVVSDAKIARL